MPAKLFIVSGPSGAGEDSVIGGLREYLPIERVITTTTRKKRPGESHGKSYYFVSADEFKKGIAEDKFFEYAQEYNDNFYGVTRKEINRVIGGNNIGIWKIEYKGVMTAKKIMPGVVAIFIMPPSFETLRKRLLKRGENEAFIQDRMNYTKEWLKHENIYDYKVVNEENKLAEAINKVKNIILVELKKE